MHTAGDVAQTSHGSSGAPAVDGASTASHQSDEDQGGALLTARVGNPRKRPVAETTSEELWKRCTAMRHVSHVGEAEARNLGMASELTSAAASSSGDVDSEKRTWSRLVEPFTHMACTYPLLH